MKKFYKFNSFISLYFDSFPVEIKVIFQMETLDHFYSLFVLQDQIFTPLPPKMSIGQKKI